MAIFILDLKCKLNGNILLIVSLCVWYIISSCLKDR